MHDNPDVAKNERQIVIRGTTEMFERAERLAAYLSTLPAYEGLRVTASSVLRQALGRGLADLEREHGVAGNGPTGSEADE